MVDDYTPSLTDEQREAVLDWMELPTKPLVYEAVARLIAQVRAETWDEGDAARRMYVENRRAGRNVTMPRNPYRAREEQDRD